MSRPTTGFDVARLAGVSQPTVSRALRNLPGTSAETRMRVIEAARALSYIPSDSGRVLSSRRTQRIAVVSEALTNPYYPELVEPIRRKLAEQGYRTVLVTDAAEGTVGLDDLADGSYDGVILTTTTRRSRLPADLIARGMPHVLVNRLLSAAAECELRVPEDLTVIGFDDIAMAGWPCIGLTTVRVNRDDMAAEAVRLLMLQIDGESSITEHRTPATLVLRSTHAEVAGDGRTLNAPQVELERSGAN